MAIQWKNGSQWKCKAEVAHREIENIRKANDGHVTPDAVVKKAAAKRNPLHGDFEWDDATAAHEHRKDTARCMLRSFVVVRGELKTERPQRVYEVTKDKGNPQTNQRPKSTYTSMEDIMKDPDTRAELLGRALRELIAIRNRYRDLQELSVVMRAIDETVETVEV